MTRAKFIEKAVRAAERTLDIPAGWWGTYLKIDGPRGERVRFSQTWSEWSVVNRDGRKSWHDGRAAAIRAARKV